MPSTSSTVRVAASRRTSAASSANSSPNACATRSLLESLGTGMTSRRPMRFERTHAQEPQFHVTASGGRTAPVHSQASFTTVTHPWSCRQLNRTIHRDMPIRKTDASVRHATADPTAQAHKGRGAHKRRGLASRPRGWAALNTTRNTGAPLSRIPWSDRLPHWRPPSVNDLAWSSRRFCAFFCALEPASVLQPHWSAALRNGGSMRGLGGQPGKKHKPILHAPFDSRESPHVIAAGACVRSDIEYIEQLQDVLSRPGLKSPKWPR